MEPHFEHGATGMVVKTILYGDIKSRNAPSLYATPVAWAVADVAQLLVAGEGGLSPYRTAIIVASDECSLSTIRELSRTAAKGNVSPLRFAGASPSIVAGLPAIEQGIRGPALCLTMKPEHASVAILALIDYWFRYSDIVSVIAIAHHRSDEGGHLFKGLLTRSAGEALSHQVRQLCDPGSA